MKAAVAHDFTHPPSIDNVPRPEPSDGQALVWIEACGLCHTDIHAAHGDWPIKPPLPLIPGREGVGIVEVPRLTADQILNDSQADQARTTVKDKGNNLLDTLPGRGTE